MLRVIRPELLQANTNNAVLIQGKEEKLNFPGNGGIQQFIKDYVERNFRVIQFEHLGLTPQYIQARKAENDFGNEVKNILAALMGPQNVDAIIEAHSQNPALLIANTFTAACLSDKLIIGQCTLTDVNLIKEGNEIYQVISIPYMPIKLMDVDKEILIPGPLTAKFKLISNRKDTKPYYQFEQLETANLHLAKMARGESITDHELLNCYDNPQVQTLTQHLIQQYQDLEQLKEANSAIQAKYNVESQARRGDQQEAIQTINGLQNKISVLLGQQSKWLQEFSQLTTDYNAKKAKEITLTETVQRLSQQVQALANDSAAKTRELEAKQDLIQAEQSRNIANQALMEELGVQIQAKQSQLQAAVDQATSLASEVRNLTTQLQSEQTSHAETLQNKDKVISDLRQRNVDAYVVRDQKIDELEAKEVEKKRLQQLNQDLNAKLHAERNHPFVLAREAQVTDVMITHCVRALENYILHLKRDIPAKKLAEYSDAARFENLARGIGQQDYGNFFDFSSLQALRKIRSCLILKDTLLQKDKSNAQKAWDLGIELKRNDHTALLESSRTSTLGYAFKILLAPFTLFASLFTYRSKKCKTAQKAMHQLFKPVEQTIDFEIQRNPNRRAR